MTQKTPMQEHIEWLKEEIEAYALLLDVKKVEALTLAKEHAESLLEKEKEVMCGIYDDAVAQIDTSYIGEEKYGEQYYNEIFNTKEK